MTLFHSFLGWLWRVVRDPALYVIGFTFYAGMHPRLGLERALLCYGATLLVLLIAETWRTRRQGPAALVQAIRDAAVWGTILFAIGLGWGASCRYILEWMAR